MVKKLGIYVHVPFCAQGKCPYCDFYSLIPQNGMKEKYINAVVRNIENTESSLKSRIVDTVYFGGGTPSVLKKDLEKILSAIKANFTVEKDAEITFEANPKTIDSETLAFLRKAGFNRLSLGMQSAINEELKILGRHHTKGDVEQIVKEARAAGFSNISLDLMLAVPKQTCESLVESGNFAASLGVEHISAYLLTIEEGTRFYELKNSLNLPDDDGAANMYLLACETLRNLGYNHYEISNFAKPGFESRHNTRYWNCDEYLGFGPSAHSYYDGKRLFYGRSLEEYIKSPKLIFESDGGSLEEYIMLRLRLKEGISQDELKKRYNTDFSHFNKKTVEKFVNAGFVEIKDGNLSLTEKGFLVSNSLIGELIFD